MKTLIILFAAGCWSLASVLGVATSAAAEPLHQRIDALIATQAKLPLAAAADDAEFLRRVYLDLAGTIPTAAQARAFIADNTANKRTLLIDQLLASPDYARRMEQALTVMLLERRDATAVPDDQWREYLQKAFAENRPWDQLVREMFAADGSDPATRPAIRFFVDGGRNDHSLMAQDVARLFLGMNVHCAQCHDHPTIAEYKQSHYYGLLAFVNQSKSQNDPKTKMPVIVEGVSAGKLEFASVFFPDVKKATGPQLPGLQEIEIPKFAKGEEFSQPAQNGLPAVPKFRPRLLLSEQLATADNRRFVRNAVNRFWFLMMGRGLSYPLDLMHEDNPPSHPQLLDALEQEFVAHKFDVKYLLREIALSAAYQRSSQLPTGVQTQDAPPESYRVANLKPLSAEQTAWSLLIATGNLQPALEAPKPTKKFSFQDYLNGRVKEAPNNLTDVMKLFEAVYGAPPGEAETDFAPSMGQALFLMNERLILQWLQPRDGNLIDRLSKIADSKALGDEIYLTLLTRLPDADEQAELAAYLQKHAARRVSAISELAWALVSSAEFRLNH